MQQAKQAERPWQWQQQIEKRTWVEYHAVPLGQKGQPTIIVWVPQRQRTLPKALAKVLGQRVAEDAEVAIKQRLRAQDYAWKGTDEQSRQQHNNGGRSKPLLI